MSATLDEAAKLKDYSSRAIPTLEQQGSYIDDAAINTNNYIQKVKASGIMSGTLTGLGTTGSWTTTVSPAPSPYVDATGIKLAVAEGEIKTLKEEVGKLKVMSNQLFDMISKIGLDKQDELERIREIIKA